MKFDPLWGLALAGFTALAAWPVINYHNVAQARAAEVGSAPPVNRDDLDRDRTIAFWEGAVREHHTSDMFSPRQLAAQYLQRYREKGDIDDVVRARAMAERSLAVQPGNVAATAEMASVNLTLHRFREALSDVDQVLQRDPSGAQFLSEKASLQMELGEYVAAEKSLGRIRPDERNDPAAETVRARLDELTGHLSRARAELADATTQFESNPSAGAQSRAWYHFRAGELAFKSGDNDAAIADERAAIDIFPTYNLALKDLAKYELANHHYAEALDAARRGADVTPFPETLGYEADAQAALGDARGAAATRDLIYTIERIGNSYRVNDRLLAIYYTDHGLRKDDALQIARREAAVRGDEIYAQDTLAWAAAMDGHWDEARRASASALRFDTEDPIVQFHAGEIALHFGDKAEAKRRLQRALALNPNFHPAYADVARNALNGLQ
jgi:tetratricopeptide (TPR) repeat protein